MADITYTVNQDNPDNIQGFEQFSQADKNLIGTFTVNSLFDSTKNFAEVHIYSLSDTLLESQYDYSKYKLLGNAQSAGKSGASVLTIDPIEDSKTYGYQYGGIKLLYHFLNDLYTTQKQKVPFYIDSISPDRTEVRLQSLELTTDEIKSYTAAIKDKLANQSYFNEFRLNFENNDLLIAINIDVLDSGDNSYVVVKLYEPLPSAYGLKSTTYVNEVVSDSVIFEVDSAIEVPQEQPNAIRPANFNLDVADYSVIPTGYYSYNDLFSYPVNNANSQVFSLVSEKGAELSIDHTDYNDFVHFSSAYERLLNFKYKLQLLENYSSSLSQITNQTSQSIGVTGSTTYYNNLTQGILSNFDHYERYLYYESSSNAWPKANSTTPYVNYSTTSSISLNWYSNQLATANNYDRSNQNLLTNTIPTYISDDDANQNYLTFVHMIGQHFDNLWIYAKAVSDKYDGDNRLDFGISKDLVGEALRNFGVKLYTSNKSIQDLFVSFTGQPYQTGSEVINNYITGSLRNRPTVPTQPIPYDDYNKEVHKRIYHNLSHLLKTKGTERGVRALINCFGIPSDILQIKTYGGRNTDETPFFGDYEYYTSSLDKIRLDNTGSIVDGDTLSGNVSIVKRDPKYTDDLHSVEIGFSPTDNIDNLIVSYSMATASLNTFSIDQYIGDPRNLTSNTYDQLDSTGSMVTDLTALTNTIMSSSAAYNVFDYVRLIKFFDNTVFKTVRDFLPARVVADTGIIIKPHLLSRSKAKSVTTTGTDKENLFTGSIATGSISGSHGNTFGSRDQYSTAYIESVQTPRGVARNNYHNQQEAKYDGELSGSQITVTNGELTEDNIYLIDQYVISTDNLHYISASTDCDLAIVDPSPRLVTSSINYVLDEFFAGYASPSDMLYTLDPIDPAGAPFTITWPYPFTGFQQYDTFTIQAENTAASECVRTVDCVFGTCNISAIPNPNPQLIDLADPEIAPIDLLDTYFSIGDEHDPDQLVITLIINEGTPQQQTFEISATQAQTFSINTIPSYQFDNNDTLIITVSDTGLASTPGGCSATQQQILAVYCIISQQLEGMQEQTTRRILVEQPLSSYNPPYTSYVTYEDTTTGPGSIGKFYTNIPYNLANFIIYYPSGDYQNVLGTIIAGGYPYTVVERVSTTTYNPVSTGGIILPVTTGFTYNNPGWSPIHHKAYRYPGEQEFGIVERDMTVEFPYLTNPNFIFENAPSGIPDGTPRQFLPELKNGTGELSHLSGRQVGLASFFTGLGNLEDIFYEVYIYRVDSFSDSPYGEHPYNSLVFAATDYLGDFVPYTVGGENSMVDSYGVPENRTTALRPNSTSADSNPLNSPGIVQVGTQQVPIWTYNTDAYNNGTNGVPGYVAMLNIDALTELVGFGKTTIETNNGNLSIQPYAYHIRIYAYTLEPTTPPLYEQDYELGGEPQYGPQLTEYGYVCQGGASVTVENWIRINGDGSIPNDFD